MKLAALLLVATRKVRRAFYARLLDARRAGPPWERSVQPNLSEWRQVLIHPLLASEGKCSSDLREFHWINFLAIGSVMCLGVNMRRGYLFNAFPC
jgi:hypothetical protein